MVWYISKFQIKNLFVILKMRGQRLWLVNEASNFVFVSKYFDVPSSITRALKGVNSDKRHGLETATRGLRNGDKQMMPCWNSDNDTGTFQNSDIPSFEIQTKDMDNPPYRAL